ncbi:MAG: molybdopterin-dependent oxidoreductase [Rhizobiales bacterium]|nr:molybdopterin-dependent oxidoreductase [Hyphomicrobiales bacterium]
MNADAPIGPTDRGPYIGRPLPRFEDLRLVRGQGLFTDDKSLLGQVFAAFVRSSHAHAQIVRIDAANVRRQPGVLAVLTGEDYRADGGAGIAQMPVPADAHDITKPAFAPSPERGILNEPHWPLATDRVRYPGEPVAVVIAETAAQARDAAERIRVDYEVLPAVTDALAALEPGAPLIWDGAHGNIAMEATFGDRAQTLAAIADAHLVIDQDFHNQRIATAQMEPRAAIAAYDAVTDSLTLMAGCQGAHRFRSALAGCLDMPPERVRVICPDTGGGFGSRNNPHPEHIVAAWAARRLQRPVKWTSDRSEAFLTDYQGRDLITRARMALSRDGRIRALALELIGNVGAQTVSYVWLSNAYRVAPTVYDVPSAFVQVRGVMTNTVPTAPFRGAGRPEATLVIERLLDIAASKLRIDRVEIRRRNLIGRAQLPYRSATGLTYDSGDFSGNMQRVLAAADWNGARARAKDAKRRGKLFGHAVCNYVESPVGAPHERVKARVDADGTVELAVGTQSTGQGHETSFAQVMADKLGVTPEDIRFVSGDTAALASGGGTHSDRSMRMAGALMVETSGRIVAQAKRVAAALLGAKEDAVGFDDGLLSSPASNRRLSVFDIARAIKDDPSLPDDLRAPLAAEAAYTGRIPAYPTGAAVCEVEIDPDTGAIQLTRYVSIDDAGQVINPMILHGQVHGGIAQGIGQALMEGVAFAPDSGQVLTGSFMDYGIPRAHLLPFFDVDLTEDPTSGNALRVKGGGESGITPALAVVMNAVMDALAPYGVTHLDMPATAERVWRAMRERRR